MSAPCRAPVRTLHLTNAYHPTSGGIRTFYRALLDGANARHREMRLVVPGPFDDREEVGDFGRIYYLKARSAPAFDRRYRVILPSAYLANANGALVRILQDERPDLVEICDKYSLFYLAGMLRKEWLPRVPRPILVGVSCERMDDNLRAYLGREALSRRFARWYLRHIYGPPFDYHVANSEYTADELRQVLWDRPPEFIRVCPMGVDAARFGPHHRDELLRRSVLERAGGNPTSTLLLYVGRLSPEKNVALLVATLERLTKASRQDGSPPRDYRLVVAGDGPMRGSMERDASRLVAGRVLFLGAVTEGELLRRYYASGDVFVHPNPREPFGIAPLEAMASGVPVVAPNLGGVLSYATRDNAWLASPEPEAFALAVRSAVERSDDRRLAAARDTAAALDWPVVVDRWFAMYDAFAISHINQNRRLAS
ncbi:MAG TPA: glycosyltransferase [Vicinamibacterales bacterium]|nr:glycosyltransferase [Vicinamibacterales bacterium]